MDSSAAIQRAINCARTIGAYIVAVPDGNFLFDSPAGISMANGIYLIGNGPSRSKFTVPAGKLVSNMITITDVSNVSVRNIAFNGNGSLASYNRAIFVSNNYGSGDMARISILNNRFENFQADCYICVINYNQDGGTSDLTISDNVFVSREGNSANPGIIGYVTSAIWVAGSHYLPRPTPAHPNAGIVLNTVIQNNQFYIPHIKNGIAIWAGVTNAYIIENVMSGVGNSGSIPDDVAAYGILVYDNAYEYDNGGAGPGWHSTGGAPPINIQIDRNRLSGIHSCGIYAMTLDSIYIRDNTISDQYDTRDVTLAKGAIVVGEAKIAVVTGNNLQNNYFGLTIVARKDVSSVVSTANNTIGGVRGGGTGLRIISYPTSVIQISDTSISGAGTYGIDVLNSGGNIYFSNISNYLGARGM